MSYWGSKPDECDFAFDSMAVYIGLIKERLEQEAATVIEQAYPEQSIIAALRCLRLIGEEFPKALSVSFRRKDFEAARSAYMARESP